MKRWYVVMEEDSSVLYREVAGPFRTLFDALAAIPRLTEAFREVSGSEWKGEAVRMYEYYALALSSENEIVEEVK
jgi:hypothetical protein